MVQSLLLAIVLAVSPSDPAAVRVTRLDGRTAEGRLVGWTAGEITIDADGHELSVSPDELLTLQRLATPAPVGLSAARLRLIDGSELSLTKVLKPFAAEQALVVGVPFADKPLALSAKSVRAIEFLPRADAGDAAWSQLDRNDQAEDLVVVKKKEDAALDTIAGVVRGFNDETVDFEWDGEAVAVKRSKVAAIGFHRHGEPASGDAMCTLTLADGSHLVVKTVKLTAEALSVRLVAGVRIELPMAALASADFSTGKLIYLSDLTPVGTRWTPYLADPPEAELVAAQGQPRSDQSFAGAPLTLRIAGGGGSSASSDNLTTFAKGLALRSRTQVAYRIPEGMTRFRATAGIDPATAREGDVTLEIVGNDRVLWEGEINGRRPPVEIDVALGDARRLELRVDYGTNRDFGDRLHLVEARVTK